MHIHGHREEISRPTDKKKANIAQHEEGARTAGGGGMRIKKSDVFCSARNAKENIAINLNSVMV